jgi:uncharacterized protein
VPARGRVLSLHRWPVKSMGGEPVDALRLDGRGVAGDRTHAVCDVHKGGVRTLTARQAPRLLAWSARYEEPGETMDPAAPGLPTLVAPDGMRWRWDDPDLADALSDDLGRPVTLTRDERGQQDLERSLLITTRATHEALESELGHPLDLRRWRTNVHVELDAPARAEDAWEGSAVQIGEARFVLLHPCVRCAIPTRDPDDQTKYAQLLRHLTREHGGLFGMNARPHGAGVLRVGSVAEFG